VRAGSGLAAIEWALAQHPPAGTKFVLTVLATFADEEWSCWPGQAKLAALTDQTERGVRGQLVRLEETGYITRQHRHRSDGTRTSDRYLLHAERDSGSQPERGSGSQPERGSGSSGDYRNEVPHDYRNVTTGQPERGSGDEVTRRTTRESLPTVGVTRAPARVGFADFWRTYPRKIGKGFAQTAWTRAVERADPNVILDAAAAFAADPHREDAFTPSPTTWLDRDGWEDDPLPARPIRGSPKQERGDAVLRDAFRRGQHQLDRPSPQVVEGAR
jgi:hypothetical protein